MGGYMDQAANTTATYPLLSLSHPAQSAAPRRVELECMHDFYAQISACCLPTPLLIHSLSTPAYCFCLLGDYSSHSLSRAGAVG